MSLSVAGQTCRECFEFSFGLHERALERGLDYQAVNPPKVSESPSVGVFEEATHNNGAVQITSECQRRNQVEGGRGRAAIGFPRLLR